MKKQIKLVMAMFAVMLVSVTSAFAYSADDLCVAAFNGDFNKVKTILDSGVDVNSRSSTGSFALYQAAKGNKTTVMKYLISRGASVDRVCGGGSKNRPIHTAAYKGNLEAVKILIYNGADPNTIDDDGLTALGNAQGEGHTKVINFLKEHGAK